MRQMLRLSPKSLSVAIVSVVLLMSASLPQIQANVTTETRYFQTAPYLQNSVQGLYAFLPWADDAYGMANYTATTTGSKKVQWSISVALYDRNGTGGFIGEKVAIVERTTNGEGWQNATWNCPETNTTMRSDVLVVSIFRRYQTFGTSWSAWAPMNGTTPSSWAMSQFISEALGAIRINASIWTVYYWTGRSYTTSTKYWFYWGNTTYNDRVENIQYEDGVGETFATDFSTGIFLGVFGGGIVAVLIAFAINKRH